MTVTVPTMSENTTRATTSSETGLHRDGAKPRLSDTIPADLLLEAGEVFTLNSAPRPEYPEGKYPDLEGGMPNFKGGIRTTRLLDSALRHLLALIAREDLDPDSRRDHAAHVVCNLSMFWWTRANRPDLDDRDSAPNISMDVMQAILEADFINGGEL